MSDFVGVWAEIKLGDDGIAKWLVSDVSGSAWEDWTGLAEDASGAEGIVKDLIAEAKEHATTAPFRVNVETKKGVIRVRCVLSLDDDMDAVANLAVALRAADKLGGEGHVYVTSLTDTDVNAHIKLAKKTSRCAEAKSGALDEIVEELMASDE